MSDFQDKCASGVSYPIEIQYALSARDKVIVDDGQVYQFTNHSGVGVREKQIADALKYESNMVLVNSLTKDYGKQYQKDLDIEIGHLNTMPIQFHASSVYEKYIITYYEKYAKWYFINKLLRYAKDDQGKMVQRISGIFTSNMKRIRKQRKNGIAKKSVRNCWNRRWKTRMLTFRTTKCHGQCTVFRELWKRRQIMQ